MKIGELGDRWRDVYAALLGKYRFLDAARNLKERFQEIEEDWREWRRFCRATAQIRFG